MTDKLGYRGYIASRAINGDRVPHHVQNIVIRDYAIHHNLQYLLSATEMSPDSCFIVLNDVLSNLDMIGGVIMYSLFMLPKNFGARNRIYDILLQNKKTLHAAVENIALTTQDDIQRMEEIFLLSGLLEVCLPAKELNS